MTQAFNLSQLANKVNTSGQLDLTSGVTGILPTANGGTGGTTAVTSLTAGAGIALSASSGAITVTNTSIGKILQVAQILKTNGFSTTTAEKTFADVTGLSVSITPSSSSNKILVFANIYMSGQADRTMVAQLLRNGASVGNGSTGFAFSRVANYTDGLSQFGQTILLDSPATTSSCTYKIQVANWAIGGGVVYVNYPNYNPDSVGAISSITVMEVTS